MTRILTVGDPHIQPSNISDMELMVERIHGVIDKEEVDCVVILGDMLHTHEKVYTPCLNLATRWIKSIAAKNKEVFLLVGNHCYINNSQFLTDNHPYNSLKEHTRVTVVDNALYTSQFLDCNLAFVPYVPPGRFMEALDTNPECKKADVIFAHQEFKGCSLGAIKSEHGDEYPEDMPLVVSGHIHDFERLQKNIMYVGTPIQHTYGETSEKTVSLFEIGDGKFKHKRINLGLPKKITKLLSPQEAESFVYNPEDNIRLKITCSASDWASFRKSSTYKKLIKDGVKVVPNTFIEQKSHGIESQEDYFSIMQKKVSEMGEETKRVFGEINEINV